MILENIKNYKIFLASNSPRRREIMKMLKIPFTTVTLEGIDESYLDNLPLHEIPVYIAKKKSEAFLKHLQPKDLVITADTMVICDNLIMGKPKNQEEACQMLKFLSGKTHKVVTGVALASLEHRTFFESTSLVRFAALTDNEIEFYVESFNPIDKAGAYGIQEWIGAVAVEAMEGSFYNVMGLPIHRVYEELKRFPAC